MITKERYPSVIKHGTGELIGILIEEVALSDSILYSSIWSRGHESFSLQKMCHKMGYTPILRPNHTIRSTWRAGKSSRLQCFLLYSSIKLYIYPLVNVYIADWKDTPCFYGKTHDPSMGHVQQQTVSHDQRLPPGIS